jgi:hypothetical protein
MTKLTKTEFKDKLTVLIEAAKELQARFDESPAGQLHVSRLDETEAQLIEAWVSLKRARRAFNHFEQYLNEDFSLETIDVDTSDDDDDIEEDEDDSEYGEDE